jgi:predicted NAD/FAD-dependent oxidoreductase
MKETETEILIVGAGVAGLMAATFLQKQGITPLVVDKGRSVGGRLATRRIGPGRADHGAQFFTVRTPDFERMVYDWLSRGLVFRWSTGWSNGSLDKAKPDGYPRFAANGGMNALAKTMAEGLEVHLEQPVASVSPMGQDRWRVMTQTGRTYFCRAVVLAAPVPHSLAVLEAGNTILHEDDRLALSRIGYAPCLTGIFQVEGPVNLPEPGAIQRPGDPISWIADNHRKGISPEATLLTVQTSPDFSREMYPAPDETIIQAMAEALPPFIEPSTRIIETQLKRWRYSLPTTLHPERSLIAKEFPPLAFAGDAFGEARVEGAAHSGMCAAAKLAAILRRIPVRNRY